MTRKSMFKLKSDRQKLTLSGCLDDTAKVRKAFEKCIAEHKQWPHRLTVDASDCHVTGAGYGLWLEMVQEHLKDTRLRYTRSQLSLLVEFDDEYPHPDTHLDYHQSEENNTCHHNKLATS